MFYLRNPGGKLNTSKIEKTLKIKCLRLEGSNFRLGGIAPIARAVPSFRVPNAPCRFGCVAERKLSSPTKL